MRVSLLSVFVATWMPSVFGIHIEIYPPSPLVNQTVILNVFNITGVFRYADWYKGQSTSAANQIIRINSNGSKINGTQYFQEADLFPNGSLVIRNVQKSHEGFYTVNVQADQLLQASVNLIVQEPATGLSAGAIAGVCIAVIAAVAAINGISVYAYKKSGSAEK